MIIASTWQIAGVDMLLFFVGLDTIDRRSSRRRVWTVLTAGRCSATSPCPSLTPMTRVIIAISIVNALQAFNLIWVMTQGGPYGSSSTFAVWTYQQSFQYFKRATARPSPSCSPSSCSWHPSGTCAGAYGR